MTRVPDIYDALDRAAAEIAAAIDRPFGQSSGQCGRSQNQLATDKPLKANTISQFGQFGQSGRRSYDLGDNSEIDCAASPKPEARGRARKSLYRLAKLATLAKSVENKEDDRGQSSGQSAPEGARLATDSAEGNPESRFWSEDHEERAAIAELDGGVPAGWTEGFACLNLAQPPCDVPPHRWVRFIDDAGRFLDGGWAERAAALGWGPLEVFGCNRWAPFARIDQAGLVWLLNGRPLIAMTEAAAVIACAAGVHQTYRRVAGQPGRVLAWDIVQ